MNACAAARDYLALPVMPMDPTLRVFAILVLAYPWIVWFAMLSDVAP